MKRRTFGSRECGRVAGGGARAAVDDPGDRIPQPPGADMRGARAGHTHPGQKREASIGITRDKPAYDRSMIPETGRQGTSLTPSRSACDTRRLASSGSR